MPLCLTLYPKPPSACSIPALNPRGDPSTPTPAPGLGCAAQPYLDSLAVRNAAVDGDLRCGWARGAGAAGRRAGAASAAGGRRCRELLVLHGGGRATRGGWGGLELGESVGVGVGVPWVGGNEGGRWKQPCVLPAHPYPQRHFKTSGKGRKEGWTDRGIQERDEGRK